MSPRIEGKLKDRCFQESKSNENRVLGGGNPTEVMVIEYKDKNRAVSDTIQR